MIIMFEIMVTPRFGDTDALKHVNNTVLAIWFEKGRNPVFRIFTPDLDLSYKKWKLILVRTEFDFLGQIYYGTDVKIKTYITHIGKSSFTIGHEAWQNNELKTRGKAVIVHYDYIKNTSMPIPEDIRKKLEAHLIEEKS